MALIDKAIGGFGDTVRFFVTYDDATLLLDSIRCVNNGDQDCWASVIRETDGLTYNNIFHPGETIFNIPPGQTNRIGVVVRPDGRLIGVSYSLMYPYP